MSPLAAALLLAVTSPAAPPPPVRVMSFNIRYATAPDGVNRWDQRKDFLAETITAFDPDLLGTQETLAGQRDFLAAKLPGFEAFAAGRDDGKEEGEMAALFYRTARFEKLAGGHFWLCDQPDSVGRKGWDAALPRVASWVKLRDKAAPDGRPVFFLNTHCDHRGAVARRESANLIRAKAGTLGAGCRVVVTGDFNAGEGSDPYTALFGDRSPLVDTFRVAHPTRGKAEGTFSGFKAAATGGDRIDWIAASRDWEVRQAGIDRTARDGRTPSDHFPVTAVLRAVAPGQRPALRVLSYNIHHGEGTDGRVDLPRIARVIRAADPDLVALQEVDDRTKRTGGVDQTAELARLTGLYGAFGKAIDYQGGGYGQAVLSRLPLAGGTVHTLPGEPDREQRIAFAVNVTALGRELTFATTHLHHQSDPLRRRQAAKLNEVFAGSGPTVLAGDLNADPDSEPLALLARHWSVVGGPNLLTFPAGNPMKQIDYVLHRPAAGLRTAGAWVIDEPVASDHRPLLAVLEPTAVAPYTRPTNIAHRGASADAPEHTLAAYQLALKYGADYVEPDLQLTKDGVLVCLHDTSLERTTNVAAVFPDRAKTVRGRKTWPVADFTLAEVQTLDAGAWKGAKFAGAKVPTFQQMIDAVKGKAGIIPETKAPEVYGRLGLNMEKAVMAVLKANNLDAPGADPRTPVVIQSFSADSLKALRAEHGCRLPLVYLFGSGDSSAERLKQIKGFADGVAPNKEVVYARPGLVADAHALGMSVTVWTVRGGQTGKFPTARDEMRHLLHDLKVDAIFTDNPDQFPRD